ncbi:IclR family transcriptional regulator [Enemella sp. A6]|uniref:IclR family transcriptional regulator n=1 Tax=Enemella sp. A6 TaxID=3440152 RepID=UPI003EB963CC
MRAEGVSGEARLPNSLHRGLQVLDLISRHRTGITVQQLAQALDYSEADTHELVHELCGFGMVALEKGRVRLGGHVVTLAARFAPQLNHGVSEGVLSELADFSGATCFVAVADGDQCVVVNTAEPDDLVIRVGYRVGSRHSLNTGAAGIAILAARAPSDDDSEDVRLARERGYAITRGHLEPGAVGMAVGFHSDQGPDMMLECSVGLVALDGLDEEPVIMRVRQAAARLAEV